MKKKISAMSIGDIVWAQVVEPVSEGEFIVNFAGDLIRVSNQSQWQLRRGQRIPLKVIGVRPLRFQLQSSRSSGGFSVSA